MVRSVLEILRMHDYFIRIYIFYPAQEVFYALSILRCCIK